MYSGVHIGKLNFMQISANKLIWALLFFAINGCSNSEEVIVPPGVIARDTMVELLTSLHLAEARILIGGNELNTSHLKSAYIARELRQANIDSTRFNSSFQFYSHNPALFTEMYEQVITEISKKKAGQQKK